MDDLVTELSNLLDTQYKAYLTNKGQTKYMSYILLKSTMMEFLAHASYEQIFDSTTEVIYAETLTAAHGIEYKMASEAFEELAKYGVNLWQGPTNQYIREIKLTSEHWINRISMYLKNPERMLTSLGYLMTDAETYVLSEAATSTTPFASARGCMVASQDLLELRKALDIFTADASEVYLTTADIFACRKVVHGDISVLVAQLKSENSKTGQNSLPAQTDLNRVSQVQHSISRKQFADMGVVTDISYPGNAPQPTQANTTEGGHDRENLNESNGQVETISTVLAQAEEFFIHWKVHGIGSIGDKQIRSSQFVPRNGTTAHTWQLQITTTTDALGERVLGLYLILAKFVTQNQNPPIPSNPKRIGFSWFSKRTMSVGFELEVIDRDGLVVIGVGDPNSMVDFGEKSCWGNKTTVTLDTLRTCHAISNDTIHIRCRIRWYNDN